MARSQDRHQTPARILTLPHKDILRSALHSASVQGRGLASCRDWRPLTKPGLQMGRALLCNSKEGRPDPFCDRLPPAEQESQAEAVPATAHARSAQRTRANEICNNN